MDEQKILNLLTRYSDKDFSTLVPKMMLRLSESETLTVEFAFWFCHIVEQDLNEVLATSAKVTNKILGPSSEELDEFIRSKYKVKFEKVDPSHSDYDPREITFGDRIDFVEKLQGETLHTKFLRKIKMIRNDLSHGRIKNLSYEGKDIANTAVKAKMISDYIILSLNIDKEEVGGAVGQFTEEEKKRVDNLWEKYQSEEGQNTN